MYLGTNYLLHHDISFKINTHLITTRTIETIVTFSVHEKLSNNNNELRKSVCRSLTRGVDRMLLNSSQCLPRVMGSVPGWQMKVINVLMYLGTVMISFQTFIA